MVKKSKIVYAIDVTFEKKIGGIRRKDGRISHGGIIDRVSVFARNQRDENTKWSSGEGGESFDGAQKTRSGEKTFPSFRNWVKN